MHEELDEHPPPRIRRHIHCLLNPSLVIRTLMEDRLQDGARAVCNVSVLPVETDGICRARPVPEAQRASARRDGERLVEGAIP